MYKIYLTIRSYTRDLYITYFESKHSRKLALYDIFRNFLSILNISKNYSEKLKKKIFWSMYSHPKNDTLLIQP